MKIVLTGSREFLAEHVRDYFKFRGHEVLLVHHDPKGEGEIALDSLKDGALEPCDIVINFPQMQVLNRKKGLERYKNKFKETRIDSTQIVKNAIERMETSPKLWVSFSSVSCYPKEDDKVYKESDEAGNDLTAELVKEWEAAATLKEGIATRSVILRTGLILSLDVGILREIIPLFKFGLGSIIGDGSEAFPWIYYRDVILFLEYLIEHEEEHGVYNTVAPHMINSRAFSQALAKVMQRKIYFKLPRKFFQKKLGDVGEIVLARSKIYPSRILKTGFNFRYPAIYPALVDAFSSLH